MDFRRDPVHTDAQMERIVQTEQQAPEEVVLDLDGWPTEQRIQAGRDVADLMEHPGWFALCDAIGQYSSTEFLNLRNANHPLPSAADYEMKLGLLRGLSKVESIGRKVVETGRETEAELEEKVKA